jgi:hypothetical protein
MIPYAELERALTRWKARSSHSATEVGGHDIVHATDVEHGSQPASLTNGTTGEIDANELVESYED